MEKFGFWGIDQYSSVLSQSFLTPSHSQIIPLLFYFINPQDVLLILTFHLSFIFMHRHACVFIQLVSVINVHSHPSAPLHLSLHLHCCWLKIWFQAVIDEKVNIFILRIFWGVSYFVHNTVVLLYIILY